MCLFCMETIKDKIERYKGKADSFLIKNKKAFIVDIKDTYYFCYIVLVGEEYLYVKNFSGKRKGEKERIDWFDIIEFDDYKEKEEVGE